MHANQFSPQQPHHNNLDPNLMPSHMNMQQPMSSPAPNAPLPQRMRGAQPPNISGSPPQPGMLQPGVAGYQGAPQGMWQGGFDHSIHDGQGHSPSDTLSNTSAQAVPMTMNVEDWFQFFGINGDLSGMNGDAPLA
ncbi:hypothetical protein G7Y89_g813 [Cudoniella acicularis]|uniref:Uncharacterized protein n=1 Tax=Cudoniella acicularis TaxID=354080 RepID=A0A8H4RY86_9HELO|nr:hypothetical protein G7Y89_g813 [Cudoniella acicularis]